MLRDQEREQVGIFGAQWHTTVFVQGQDGRGLGT